MSVLPLTHDDDDQSARAKPKKAPTAFRTISEVADELHIPQHVLRFWETKFAQVKPLKRGGGRRYYRPDDVALLRRIAHLLYTQGYTIKGVQRLLREGGGRLADDIPPPLIDDQDADGENEAEAMLIAEGSADDGAMAEEARPEPRLPLRFIPRSGPMQPALPLSPSAAEQELERLRRAMIDTLAELEALRALVRG
jgi:DNA-binding transcriptional MerR regulator